MKLIGVSAFAARSGKDTLAKCLQVILTERGKTVVIKSLATPLKSHMQEFIYKEFGIDIFNCTDEEKALVRGLLVAYGGARRKQTHGKYWTSLMDAEIRRLTKENVDYLIVPDIRYAEFEGDEVDWIKEWGGALFFVSLLLEDGQRLLPPNEDEEKNGPILEQKADITIEWPHMSFEECLKFTKQCFHLYEEHL